MPAFCATFAAARPAMAALLFPVALGFSLRLCPEVAQTYSSEDAYWRVRKIGESGSVRMFESLSKPDSYLRIKDGHCDVQVRLRNSSYFR